jgi:hypothetical protein
MPVLDTQDAAALGGRAASKLASEQSLDRVQVLGVIFTGETPMQIRGNVGKTNNNPPPKSP